VSNNTLKITRFALLTALALVLGWLDSQFPLLEGVIPGFKLGLSNTVILYAIYLLDWKSSILMAVLKVGLTSLISGMRFPAIWLSIAGSALSLCAMLLLNRKSRITLPVIGSLAAASEIMLFIQHPSPKGIWLWAAIIIPIGSIACFAAAILIRKGIVHDIQGTSIAGAIAHNTGQIIAYCIIMKDTKLMIYYLPLLIGIGAVVGYLTGIVTERVLKALRYPGISSQRSKKDEA